MGIAQKSKMPVITHLPPSLSVRMPIGNRITEPTKTGIPNKKPISTEFHVNKLFSTKKVTNTPLIIHAAKQTVNAMVLRNNMRCDFALRCVSIYIIYPELLLATKTYVLKNCNDLVIIIVIKIKFQKSILLVLVE